MRNTIILTIILFIAVIGASVYYFSDLNGEKKETLRPLTFLPQETFLISTFHNDATTDNIFKDFEIFEALVGKQEIKQWKELKLKILRNEILQPYVEGVEIYVSLHPEKDHLATLFTIPTTEKISPESLAAILSEGKKSYNIRQKDTLDTRIYSLDKGVKDSVFHIIYFKDIFFASRSDSLLYKIIDGKSSKIAKEEIDYFVENNSRNSPLSVYFSHKQIKPIINHFFRSKSGGFLRLFENLGGESAWNLNFKNDALILSGESKTARQKENYLEIFAKQSKTTQTLFNFFPENTASYLSFAISNTGQFQEELAQLFEQRDELEKLQQQLKDIENKKNLSIMQDIRPLLGNEFSVVEQSNQTMLAFISLSEMGKKKQGLLSLATAVGDSIFRFDYSNIPYALFGDPLKNFARPYFVRLQDVLVLSNSANLLQTYLHDWRNENLLINTLGFKNFEKTQGNEANITFFQRTKTASTILSSLLKHDFSVSFRDREQYGYQDFYSWSAQISGNNGNFLTSIYGIYKSKHALGATADWTYDFNNRPITAPWVFEHSDTSQFILIQEQDHTVHGIHPSGTQLWSSVFHGRIVGEARQLSDRSIVLVTDKNRLYRFAPQGKALPGFSLGLEQEPTFTPTVAKLTNEQLIFIPAGRNLLVYTLDGKPSEQWNNISLAGNILFDVKVQQNHLFIGTDNGHFYQFDANGTLVKESKIDNSQFRNPITLGLNNKNQVTVYAIDTSGNLIMADFQNPASKRKIGDWDSKTIIAFDDIGQQSTARMVAIDHKKLSSKAFPTIENLYDFTFTQEVSNRPQFFSVGGVGNMLGIASRESSLIYLFDEKGLVYNGFPIEALPDFYYGKIDYNSANYLLCVRRDKKLYAFKN